MTTRDADEADCGRGTVTACGRHARASLWELRRSAERGAEIGAARLERERNRLAAGDVHAGEPRVVDTDLIEPKRVRSDLRAVLLGPPASQVNVPEAPLVHLATQATGMPEGAGWAAPGVAGVCGVSPPPHAMANAAASPAVREYPRVFIARMVTPRRSQAQSLKTQPRTARRCWGFPSRAIGPRSALGRPAA